MNTFEIEKRYSMLANDTCCLSCGSAFNYSRPQKGEICVDLGCGRGNDVLRMAEEVGREGKVYGVDITDTMLDKARRTARKMKIKNVEFIKSDLESLPFEDDTMDLLISNCTINHVGNKDVVWHEIYRILKYGGRFVVSDIYSVEDVPDKYRNNPVAVSECWAGAVTKEVYLSTLNHAGFRSTEILEESAPYQKGNIIISSITIAGQKTKNCCCS
jgi:ubiquinone/menaquinone biosynthesis C-methylase UbiE